jgi:hypothetical protein
MYTGFGCNPRVIWTGLCAALRRARFGLRIVDVLNVFRNIVFIKEILPPRDTI